MLSDVPGQLTKRGFFLVLGLMNEKFWQDPEETQVLGLESGKVIVDQSKILPVLFYYFNVDNLADMLEKVEEIIGDNLYADVDDDMNFDDF